MEQDSTKVPNNIEGVAIHLSYLRSDVTKLTKKLDELAHAYISAAEFAEHLEADKDHERRIRKIEEFKDTLVGKMWGVGVLAGFIVGVFTLIVDHYWKIQ